MKQFFITLLFLQACMLLKAQEISQDAALKLVNNNIPAIGFSETDMANVTVSNAYKSTNGIELVYLQQSYLGLPVLNQLYILAFSNGKLVSKSGRKIKGLEKRSPMNSSPSVSATAAVRTAMADKKLFPVQSLIPNTSGRKADFGKLGIAHENITAELMWVPVKDDNVRLAWQVYLVPKSSADYFLIRVDAADNRIISETNLTDYCNWDASKEDHIENACAISEIVQFPLFFDLKTTGSTNQLQIINGASYRVVPFPAESPIHPGGAHALITDPWNAAPGNATSLKWHSNGTTDYTITRGNNVWAQEDQDNNNGTGIPATSTTGSSPLTFNFTPDYTVTPLQTTPVPNQQFNITNLFYWNNIIHDITYQYGFTEAAGNFQANNQGRGGSGNDYVLADAQDGGGTNNANFSTPADGGSGRMQMYLWNGTPQKDGDVDNGVIVHEYGHGISNRLTGGPSQAGCLGNAEQMGEGWSDYYALMITQDWAGSNVNTGFNSPRGIGTYANGQSATGTGIRSQRYCTNFAINNKVYAASISAQQHSRGEIWCATLWDMTWNIINQVNSINPNIYNPAGGGGNTIALRLVTEGMKLQPCSPGFIDGRDAILQADQILYGGAYNCVIKEAFRRRGMGPLASQGSSDDVTDQVADFSSSLNVTLTQNAVQVNEGQNIIYTNTVSTCSAVSNYILTDTLPSNVTYVSGGSYNSGNRVVSFPVNLAAGQTQTYSFTVNVNNGSYFTPVTLLDEQFTTGSMPATLSQTSTTATIWNVSSTQSHSPGSSVFSPNLSTPSDQILFTTSSFTLGSTPYEFSFWHSYNSESGYDGGIVEISTDGGSNWTDLGPKMNMNGYNGVISSSSGTPLAGKAAFTGQSTGFVKTPIDLSTYANQNVKFRWRFSSDVSLANVGWYVDDIFLKTGPVVSMRSSLFNTSSVRVAFSDTVTVILQSVCDNVSITTQPVNTTTCAGSNITISVVAGGTSITYQWQVSTDGGTVWTNIPSATSATLTLSSITAGMNNYRYKVIISNTCPSSVTSNVVILTVNGPSTITTQPANVTVCTGTNTTFTVAASGSPTYQWQVSSNGGTTWTNISSATSTTLTLTAVTTAMKNNQYRAIVSNSCPQESNAAILTVNNCVTICSCL